MSIQFFLRHKIRFTSLGASFVICSMLYHNCAPADISATASGTPTQNSSQGSGAPQICTPFAGTGSTAGTSSANGIAGTITYLMEGSNVNLKTLTTSSFLPGQPSIQVVPGTVILNQFNVVTQDFSLGFKLGDGTFVVDNDNKKLDQYFSLQAKGQIALAANTTSGVTTPGSYQFAVLADDGAIFSVTDSDGSQITVNDDGVHSNKFVCATTAASLKAGKPLSYSMNYYQGPAVRISLMLFWRKVDPTNANTMTDPYCPSEQLSDSDLFSSDANDNPVPTNTYAQLLARGWQVVPAGNFYLPAGQTNTCTQ